MSQCGIIKKHACKVTRNYGFDLQHKCCTVHLIILELAVHFDWAMKYDLCHLLKADVRIVTDLGTQLHILTKQFLESHEPAANLRHIIKGHNSRPPIIGSVIVLVTGPVDLHGTMNSK